MLVPVFIHTVLYRCWNNTDWKEVWYHTRTENLYIHSIDYKKNTTGMPHLEKKNPAVKVNSLCRGDYWEIINVNFDAAGQLLIIHSAFIKYLRKN